MQFIKVYENAISEQLMQELRDWADRPDTDLTIGHGKGKDQFPNKSLGRNDSQKFLKFSNPELMAKCHEQLSPYFHEYVEKYPGIGLCRSHEVKLQKTPIQGGYSVWHCEQGPESSANRVLAWMVYLNDVEEGGETEFLYQSFKQKSVKGTLLIWPASFTHTHRGNPPYSNNKYIITGWGLLPTSVEDINAN